MLSDYIFLKIKEKFGFVPTDSQLKAMNDLGIFLSHPDGGNIFVLNGFAGTGKTTLMNAFCAAALELEFPLMLMAPTGRAAKVLSSATGMAAYTVHKCIYRQEHASEGNGAFQLNYNKQKDTVFVVDEASMISNSSSGENQFGTGRLLEDLLDFVFSRPHCRLLLLGDTAQLPPVGLEVGPALNPTFFFSLGYEVNHCTLHHVVRHDSQGAILLNSTQVREAIVSGEPVCGYPKLWAQNGSEVERLDGAELIETLISSYDRFGLEQVLVVTRSNKRANQFNQGIRNAVLFKEEELTRGDLLMVVKNNYFWMKASAEMDFIANGDIAEVVRINGYSEMYGCRFADVSLTFLEHNYLEVDAKIMLDVLRSDSPKLTQSEEEAFFLKVMEDYAEVPSARKRLEALRTNPYYNALQVKFAYAVTCHKAQGGQWDAVFVDVGYMPEEQMDTGFYKWLYTALTRAVRKVFLVNFKDDFFWHISQK